MLLAHLPLRPSTQQLLQTRGFATVQEVMDSYTNNSNNNNNNRSSSNNNNTNTPHNYYSLSNLAAELGTSWQIAGGIWQEIQQLVLMQQQQQQQQQQQDNQGDDDNNSNNNNKKTTHPNNAMHKENHPQSNATTETATATMMSSTPCNNNNNNVIHYARNRPRTAHDILLSQQQQQQQQPFAVGNTSNKNNAAILTFCRDIDQLLAGGVALGELTELVGPPGSGKTQWGMQLAVDCSLPVWIGGVCGQTCYIDTEGSFCPERCHVLAAALIQHIQRGMVKRQQQQQQQHYRNNSMWNVTADDILRGIHVIRVHDQADLQATLMGTLPRLAQEQAQAGTPLRLVVVDSMAFPIRAAVPPPAKNSTYQQQQQQQQGSNNNNSHVDFYVERNRQLTVAAQQLAQLAVQYHLAAVAMNQMTTKFVPTTSAANNHSTTSHNSSMTTTTTATATTTTTTSQLVPALGESWAHAVTTRILLSSFTTTTGINAPPVVVRRTCTLVKSPRLPTGSADYQVLECGIRGVNHDRPSSSSSSSRASA